MVFRVEKVAVVLTRGSFESRSRKHFNFSQARTMCDDFDATSSIVNHACHAPVLRVLGNAFVPNAAKSC